MSRLPIAKTYKLYINGRFPRTESGRSMQINDATGQLVANACRASRKDFREAVVAARGAFQSWSATNAYLRGQVLYRVAETLEGRSAQFTEELCRTGMMRDVASAEVGQSVDRLVHYAGWSDKVQQIFSAVNPVASSHFSFSVLEPMGVVAMVMPKEGGLLSLVSNLAPAVVGANTCVVLAAERNPLPAVALAEVLHASDVPAGVVNILTGQRDELVTHFASHMDVNAVVLDGSTADTLKSVHEDATQNLKRVIARSQDWASNASQSPYFIKDTQEVKTTWHPIGR